MCKEFSSWEAVLRLIHVPYFDAAWVQG